MTAALPRFQAPADGGLSRDMVEAFRRDGVLVLEGFLSEAVCDGLKRRAAELIRTFDPATVSSVFSSTTHAHYQDGYFQTSGDKIRFFLEEEAFAEDGTLNQDKSLSINKIGHALHDLDPAFEAFSHQVRLGSVARALGQRDPLALQSMYIFKQPGIGGEVVCHQDSTFLYTDPPSVIGLWFALEDATIDNGCLWGMPGHHVGPLKQRYRKRDGRLTFDVYDTEPWPENGRVPLEADQGTLIVLHGQFPHFSGPNRSSQSRHAYTLHAIDGTCRYPEDNWLVHAADMPLRGFDSANHPSL